MLYLGKSLDLMLETADFFFKAFNLIVFGP